MNPFEVVPLITSVPCKISSIACHDEYVYVGTNDGQVLLYRTVPGGRPSMTAKVHVSSSKKPVERMQVVPTIGHILTLSDNVLTCLNMFTLKVVVSPTSDRFPAWRQCNAFSQQDLTSVSDATGSHDAAPATSVDNDLVLAVASNKTKKITLYKYVGQSIQFEYRRDVLLQDMCYGLQWAADKILAAATRKDFYLINSESGRVSSIVLQAPPTASKHAQSDSGSLLSSSHGEMLLSSSLGPRKFLIEKNAVSPHSMVYVNNSLIIVRDGQSYEISLSNEREINAAGKADPTPYILTLLNIAYTNPVTAKASSIMWSAPPIVVCPNFPYLVSLLPHAVEVHSVNKKQSLQILPSREGTPFSLVSSSSDGKRCILACSSAVITGNVPACVFELRMQTIDSQIRELIVGHKFDDAVQLYEIMNVSIRGTQKYDDGIKRIHNDSAEILMKSLEFSEAFDHYTLADVNPRLPMRWFPDVCPQNVLKDDSGDKLDIEATIRSMYRGQSNQAEMAKHLKNARLSLVDYLKSCQLMLKAKPTAFGAKTDSDGMEELRDMNTVIVKLMTQVLPEELERFMSANGNMMQSEDVEKYLWGKKLWSNLAVFYDAEGKTKEALDVWRRLGTGELHEHGHNGVNETVAILCRPETDISLVWIYASWLMPGHSSSALRIFNSQSHVLNFEEVVQYLEKCDAKTARKYLEHHLLGDGVVDVRQYTRLATMFVTELVACVKKTSTPVAMSASALYARGPEFIDTHNKLIQLLKRTDVPTTDGAEAVLRVINEAGLSETDLFDEQIAAYSRLGRHRDALRIILRDLHDDARAETYCTSLRTQEEKASLLIILLELYLEEDDALMPARVGSKEAPMLNNRILNFLERNGRDIDPVAAFMALPNMASLSGLLPFIEKAFRATLHAKHDSQILKSLLRVQHLNLQVDLARMQRQVVYVDGNTLCAECRKELSDKMFVKMPGPRGKLICSICWTKKNNGPQSSASTQPANTSPFV